MALISSLSVAGISDLDIRPSVSPRNELAKLMVVLLASLLS